MPVLPLPLPITTTPLPEAIELRGATIREWGATPAFGSGMVWTVRKLVVVTANGVTLTLYRTHFSASDETPAPGSRCDIIYRHRAEVSALSGEGCPAAFDSRLRHELPDHFISTSSSDMVGCSATVWSKASFVIPAFTATAAAWRISGASGPIMWRPTTRPVVPSQIIL